MPQSTDQLPLWTSGRREIAVAFDAPNTTSDAGVVLLGRLDEQLGLCQRLAAVIADPRAPLHVQHTMPALLRQRILQIAMGWEDCNDAQTLRTDPAFKMACGRLPVSGGALASQPTLSRTENLVTEQDLLGMRQALLDDYLSRQPRRRRLIVIDADVTDAETHGHQQLSFFNGYYGHTCLTPLLVFDGRTSDLLAVSMRSGKAGTGDGLVEVLTWLVPQLKARWPGARIRLRVDSGFCWPQIIAFCEARGLEYLIALTNNAKLNKLAAFSLQEAKRLAARHGDQRQVFGVGYYQMGSWPRPRKVIWKAEAGPHATDVRFVVTNLLGLPRELYRLYAARGASENWIKAFKVALNGDRVSCHKATANQFRLLLHAAAYQLMLALRHSLAGTEAETWQFDTLRLRLLKVGGWVKQTVRRIVFHLPTSHPHQDLWALLAQRWAPA